MRSARKQAWVAVVFLGLLPAPAVAQGLDLQLPPDARPYPTGDLFIQDLDISSP